MPTPAHVHMITCMHAHTDPHLCAHTLTCSLTHAPMIMILHRLTCTHSRAYKHTPEPHHFVQGQLGTWPLDEITKQLGPDDARTSEVCPCWFHYFLVSYGAEDLTQWLCKDWGIGGAGGWRSASASQWLFKGAALWRVSARPHQSVLQSDCNNCVLAL